MSERLRARAGVLDVSMPLELLKHQYLDDRAKLLYLVLKSHLGSAGAIFPKRVTLAGALGCSEASVDRAIRQLVEWGYLDVIHRVRLTDGSIVAAPAGPLGRGAVHVSNEYVLLPPPEVTEHAERGITVAATRGLTRDEQSGLRNPPEGGDRAAALRPPSELDPRSPVERRARHQPDPIDPLASERAALPRRREVA